jgi:hypothetical protein
VFAAEAVELGRLADGLFGRGEGGEGGFGGNDLLFEKRDGLFGFAEFFFELFLLDGVEAFAGSYGA